MGGATADECVAPDCVQVPQPCANNQVSGCPPLNFCSKIKHGMEVYCTDDHVCGCKEGFCANSEGVCVEQPMVDCTKKVSSCTFWPHHSRRRSMATVSHALQTATASVER